MASEDKHADQTSPGAFVFPSESGEPRRRLVFLPKLSSAFLPVLILLRVCRAAPDRLVSLVELVPAAALPEVEVILEASSTVGGGVEDEVSISAVEAPVEALRNGVLAPEQTGLPEHR